MNEIQDKIRQAQRRLWFNRWLAHLGWAMAGAAAAFILFVVVVRLTGLFRDEDRAAWRVTGILAAAGFLASFLWTYATRDSLPMAAARLDQAAGLKERLSTALYFASSADPFARAAVADANNVSRLVTPQMYLPVKVPASAPYAGGATFVALLVLWLFPAVDLSGRQAARAEEAQKQVEIKKVEAQVIPVAQALRKLEQKHPEIKKESVEPDPLEAAKLDTPADLKRAALKQINAAAEKLNDKKTQAGLAKVDEFKNMLRHLAAQPTPPSIVGQLSKSLAKGDFKSAQATLDSIRQEINKEPQSVEDKAHAEQLKGELKKVSESLNKIAESNSKVKDQLEKMNLNKEDVDKLMQKINSGELNEIAKKLAE